jgi:hypothetical protein
MYELLDIPLGIHEIRAVADGFCSEKSVLEVTDSVQRLNFSLVPSSDLSIYVVGASREPVSEAVQVRLEGRGGIEGQGLGGRFSLDESGRIALSGLRPGVYELFLWRGAEQPSRGTMIDVVAGGNRVDVEVAR